MLVEITTAQLPNYACESHISDLCLLALLQSSTDHVVVDPNVIEADVL